VLLESHTKAAKLFGSPVLAGSKPDSSASQTGGTGVEQLDQKYHGSSGGGSKDMMRPGDRCSAAGVSVSSAGPLNDHKPESGLRMSEAEQPTCPPQDPDPDLDPDRTSTRMIKATHVNVLRPDGPSDDRKRRLVDVGNSHVGAGPCQSHESHNAPASDQKSPKLCPERSSVMKSAAAAPHLTATDSPEATPHLTATDSPTVTLRQRRPGMGGVAALREFGRMPESRKDAADMPDGPDGARRLWCEGDGGQGRR